jgi:hypothetical protein
MDHRIEKLLYSRRDTAEALCLSIRSVDYLEANPPDVGVRHLFKDAPFLANHFSRPGIYPLMAILAALEQSGPISGASTIFDFP